MSPEDKLDALVDALSELASQNDQSIPKQAIAQVLENLGYISGDEWEETE